MARAAYDKKKSESGIIKKLFDELNSATEVGSEGRITFVRSDYQDLFSLLGGSVVVSDDNTVTKKDVAALSRRSFLDLRRKGRVSEKELIAELNKRLSTLLKEQPQRYSMWTKCRLSQMAFAKGTRFDFDDVQIRTTDRLPNWMQLDEFFVSGVGHIEPNLLPFFGYMVFSTNARNENEAVEKIFEVADVFIAVVNMSMRSLEFVPQRRSSAKLWLGPNQFFFKNKKLIDRNLIYYNPNYSEKEWNLFPLDAKKFSEKAKNFRKCLRVLENHPLKSPLKTSMQLVSSGMISSDLSYRLLRFWSATEALYSDENQKTNMEKVQNRLLFASKKKWLDKLKLDHAYKLRNSYVHGGQSEGDDTTVTEFLREILINHIYYYLFNGSDFQNHKEMLNMVDLPSTRAALDAKALAIQRRISVLENDRHYSKK